MISSFLAPLRTLVDIRGVLSAEKATLQNFSAGNLQSVLLTLSEHFNFKLASFSVLKVLLEHRHQRADVLLKLNLGDAFSNMKGMVESFLRSMSGFNALLV